jgi:hypothetical protein
MGWRLYKIKTGQLLKKDSAPANKSVNFSSPHRVHTLQFIQSAVFLRYYATQHPLLFYLESFNVCTLRSVATP